MKKETVGPGSNVFEALGRSPEVAANLLIRSQLMGNLKQYIKDNGMSLRVAGDFFGIAHPRISDLMQGNIDKFTIDYLVNMTCKTGKRVTLIVEDDLVTSLNLPD